MSHFYWHRGTIQHIDFNLSYGGKVTGIVTNESGQPVSGLWVWAFDYEAGNFINTALTAEDGSYLITLPVGSYWIWADGMQAGFVDEWYYNASFGYEATEIQVIVDQTTADVNFALVSGGAISGIVADAAGNPIPDLWVYAYEAGLDGAQNSIGSGRTQPDGSYTIMGLPSGDYKVRVDTWGVNYVAEYYPDSGTYESADSITVVANQTTGGVNFALALGAIISGIVADDLQNPVGGLTVWAYDAATYSSVRSGETQSDGSYVIQGLPAGNYKVQVSNWDSDYLQEYYHDKNYFDTADTIIVSTGLVTDNISFVLTLGGRISGMVVDVSGQPIENLRIHAFDSNGNFGYTFTSNDGTYLIKGLAEGPTTVEAISDGTYATTYYQNKRNFADRDPVNVVAGMITTKIDFYLTMLGDVNNNGNLEIADCILGLQIMSGLPVTDMVQPLSDINGDGKIRMEEVIFVLHKITE